MIKRAIVCIGACTLATIIFVLFVICITPCFIFNAIHYQYKEDKDTLRMHEDIEEYLREKRYGTATHETQDSTQL